LVEEADEVQKMALNQHGFVAGSETVSERIWSVGGVYQEGVMRESVIDDLLP
jgi:hypothetical protein